MAVDPICGMTVDPSTALSSVYEGQTFYFCNPSCKARFEADPGKWAGGAVQEGMHSHRHGAAHAPDKAVDPVCGMTVDPSTAISSEYEGETFYFCNPACKARFEAEHQGGGTPPLRPAGRRRDESERGAPHPALRATFSPRGGEKEAEKTEYTCPMHPEIVRSEPGFCPICG